VAREGLCRIGHAVTGRGVHAAIYVIRAPTTRNRTRCDRGSVSGSCIAEEEAQGGHGAVHGRSIHAPLGLMDLEATDVLSGGSTGERSRKAAKPATVRM
jgi:hypothetical protein